ncbi:MAG: TerC/Alx family metal homeostasis membrane protein [Pirellulaceae bacterium]|nr:TerC/Alx family metal homeostasis membrane protein [Pirellulaceae bacterium]
MNSWLWIGFIVFVFSMLALDLGVFQRKPHVVTSKEALLWFGVWSGMALAFNVGIVFFHSRGAEAGLEFFAGYLVEKSLSIDNIFVFILIFQFFNTPPIYQHKVLFWGIVGAIVLRMAFIVGGLALLERFHWIIYVFGAFLLMSGIGMMRNKETDYDPEKNWIVRSIRKIVPTTGRYDTSRFFVREGGRLCVTPLLIVLLAIESSDILFAVDSIPAIFAISNDTFIIFTSNIFAMLGLRSLYLAVSGIMQTFHFLHYGFASILTILGVKMLISDFYEVPIAISLTAILIILLICVIVSLLRPRKADLKLMFERTEKLGHIPFRRLLMIENIIDLGELRVRDAMCSRADVISIRLDKPWHETATLISEMEHSRYPVIEQNGEKPIGIVHIKSICFADPAEQLTSEHLKMVARTGLEMQEDMPLEEALTKFQQHYDRMAIVINGNSEWTGILTYEDVLGQIVGSMGDEFDLRRHGPMVSLADLLTPSRIVLDLSADSMSEAIQKLIATIPREELAIEPELIVRAILQREKTHLLNVESGLAIPFARLSGIDQPLLAFARSRDGIPIKTPEGRIDLVFLVVIPYRMARIQSQMLANIEGLLASEYVADRLRKAPTPEKVIEAIRAGQEVVAEQGIPSHFEIPSFNQ